LQLGARSRKEKVYYIRYRNGGREARLIEERVGRKSEGMTAAMANRIRADRARGREMSNRERRAAEAARGAKENRPTVDRIWRAYAESNADKRSHRQDALRYRIHLQAIFGHREPGELETAAIDRLRNKLLQTHAPQTVKHILCLLRRIVNFGTRNGLCPQPDSSRLCFVYPKVDNQKTENMTREHLKAYLEALDAEPDQAGVGHIRLALLTGMRKGALLALQWSDIDFEHGFITLRGEHAKNRKTGRIPLSNAARSVLEKLRHDSGTYVFPGPDGEKQRDFNGGIARRVRDMAGLPKDFRPLHGLRHTFASWMASSGAVDLYTLQKLLTHDSAQMTQRYAHLADDALRRAAEVGGDLFLDAASANFFPKKSTNSEKSFDKKTEHG
jgi:integrase